MVAKSFSLFLILVLSCFRSLRYAESQLPQEEVDALQQITSRMGAKYWQFDSKSCKVEMVGMTQVPLMGSEGSVVCDCNLENNTVCHVVQIVLKGLSLPGVLPPELVKLSYLQVVDFALNYLSGSIPHEWASMQLNSISLLANRLSGEIPKILGNISSLTYLTLEANQFSGVVPSEIGNLINLKTLILSSNQLSGKLPQTFAGLTNLTDFRINDNNFNGTIPDYIPNWKQLTRLELDATGLEGTIPSNISSLDKLTDLRITDINGPIQGFPLLSKMALVRLVLRNCNISGEIPGYIWTMKFLQMLDVSFNKLAGEIPTLISTDSLKFLYLTGNLFSGDVPDSILMQGSSVDLSYNNFTRQGPERPACQLNMNLNINLFRSSSEDNLSSILPALPCVTEFTCPRYSYCSHVNCGGNEVIIKENNMNIIYEGDGEVQGGAADYYRNDKSNWGFSSTGDFMDDNNYQNRRYTKSINSSSLSELYTTARLSPLSLTYFHYCLENGNYTVKLHFAEIQFTNDTTYRSLGRRIFDIYVQERLVWEDFNIEDEAHGVQKPVLKELFNVSVTKNILEIRFAWAGKGTTRIPDRGVYGPLISAISVTSNFRPCTSGGKSLTVYIIVGVGGAALCLVSIILGIFWLRGCSRRHEKKKIELMALDLQTGSFTLKQVKSATNDFDPANKIGEGGFGPVYKGILSDGTVIAVKQLSSKSKQGNREFLNEIGMIFCLQHPNLVKLYGFCMEKDQLLLVYEYMENNSLASVLFGSENNELKLDWPTRLKICIGVARGLAFLHEESRLKIVHRDIKATNVLLDRDLNPKISDFGLAKLDEEDKTHISTRVAGTVGYMAPEYALWGHLTNKADVYSFGVLALELVSGKNNNNFMPSAVYVCLLDWACHMQKKGNLTELLDDSLGLEVDKEEAERMVKVALLCTNASASLRPTMSEVVAMLEGRVDIPDIIPEPSTYTGDLRFKAMKDLRRWSQQNESSTSGSQTQNSTNTRSEIGSTFTLGQDSQEINRDSKSS